MKKIFLSFRAVRLPYIGGRGSVATDSHQSRLTPVSCIWLRLVSHELTPVSHSWPTPLPLLCPSPIPVTCWRLPTSDVEPTRRSHVPPPLPSGVGESWLTAVSLYLTRVSHSWLRSVLADYSQSYMTSHPSPMHPHPGRGEQSVMTDSCQYRLTSVSYDWLLSYVTN